MQGGRLKLMRRLILLLLTATAWAANMEVLMPNGSASNTALVQKYLASNAAVAGFTFDVQWADFDNGNKYDFATTDAILAPWLKTGKKVNLIVWANADNGSTTCTNYGANGTANCAIPAYVWTALGSTNYAACPTQYGSTPQRIPNSLDPKFQAEYQAAMKAVVAYYGSNPGIGYIRFGLGHGGETLPVSSWTTCFPTKWGVTISTWEGYLKTMLEYEASLKSPKQLLVGVTPMGSPGDEVPDYVASVAAPLGIGFGSQGLEKSDVSNCAKSTADWCNLFAKYKSVPHELQTLLQSCSNDTCTTGSLTVLLPFAVKQGATIIELYYQDWFTAFDPSYPGYTATYAKAIQVAAQ